ncbi:hypothetical protein RAD15_06140 [Bradyrhizobium sp. 14AA]
MEHTWIYQGRCWKFGHDVAVDGDLMPLEFALRREMSPEVLKNHIFSRLDPSLAKSIQPGDIVVAGKRFAQGNPHIQGLIGLRGAGVGLVVESIPSGSYRNAISAGLPFLPRCENILNEVDQGDLLRVDISTGEFTNESRGTRRNFNPLPIPILEIIANGGWKASFRARLEREKQEDQSHADR